ncbi:poly(3-hydroxyalkanoate) synthetase [Paracidovorax cattleyae]|nr:poly(3-hydroxyalkanoate) synthetase [Paracidovorax cattleyae]
MPAVPPEGAAGLAGAWEALRGSSATLALTLSARASPLACETDAAWVDPWAAPLLAQCPWDLRRAADDPALVRAVVVRSRVFDRLLLQACAERPVHAVASLGVGLCTRQGRLAPSLPGVEWIDADLPEVIALRRLLLPSVAAPLPGLQVAGALQDGAWLDAMPWQPGRHFLVLLEGVAPYVPPEDVLHLLERLAARARREGCGCRVVLDYLHPDFVPIAAWQAGPAMLPVVSGFRDAAALVEGSTGFCVLQECRPFGLFSEAHQRFEDEFRGRHGQVPYAVVCLEHIP